MKVQDIMTREPTCCTPNDTLQAVARVMGDCDCGAVPVVDNLETRITVGIVTDRDIVTRVIARGEDCIDTRVEAAMTPVTVTVTGDADVREAEELMKEKQIRRLLVVDEEGRCVGILAQADIARHAPESETGDMVEEISEPSAV